MNASTPLSTGQKGNSLIYVLLGVLILAAVIFVIAGGTTYMILGMGKSQLVPPVVPLIVSPTPYPPSSLEGENDWIITKNEPKGSNTVESKKLGFSFQYPIAWRNSNSKCSGPDATLCLGEQDFYITEPQYKLTYHEGKGISIVVLSTSPKDIQNQVNLDNSLYFKQLKSETFNNIKINLYVTKTTINLNDDPESTVFEIYTTFNNVENTASFGLSYFWPAPSLDAMASTSEINNSLSDFNKLLSTFRFTIPTPTSVTQQSCNSSNDCPSGSTCQTIGPIVDTPKRVCVPEGQMVPFTGKN